MRQIALGYYLKLMLLCGVIVVVGAGTVMATAQSDNFEVSEPEFGAGAALDTCSGEYCANATIGNVSGGKSSSPGSTADFDSGVPTSDDPMLEVIIEEGDSDLGVLSTDKTSSKTTIIRVRNYLSDGYTLHIMGNPPKYANHTLATSTSPVASQMGTEQFGINVVANTVPAVGADPLQVPSDEMSFGYALPNYAVPNLFMYDNGDAIARSDKATGRTDYTVSMIVNVEDNTPAGHYSADLSAVIIPVF